VSDVANASAVSNMPPTNGSKTLAPLPFGVKVGEAIFRREPDLVSTTAIALTGTYSTPRWRSKCSGLWRAEDAFQFRGVRRVRHTRVVDRRGERHGDLPWLVRVRRAADGILAARAHRRSGARADGSRVRRRHYAVVAPQGRRTQRQIHATQRRPDQAGSLSSLTPSSPRRPTRSWTSWTSSPRRTRARSRASRWPGFRRSPA